MDLKYWVFLYHHTPVRFLLGSAQRQESRNGTNGALWCSDGIVSLLHLGSSGEGQGHVTPHASRATVFGRSVLAWSGEGSPTADLETRPGSRGNLLAVRSLVKPASPWV